MLLALLGVFCAFFMFFEHVGGTPVMALGFLFAIGFGPVRGFAVTLGVGIITSVFAALYITRVLIVLWFDARRPKTIEV